MTDPLPVNPLVAGAEAPPIAEAWGWVAGRSHPPERPLIDVCQAVPNYPPAPALRAHLAAAVDDPGTSRYAPIPGLPDLRAALARRMADLYGGPVAAEEILISAGCNQAFTLALMALARPGDNVILPVPWYFNHKMILDMIGVEVRPLPVTEAGGLVPDPAAAAALMDGRTRALVLVSPNNPTGTVTPPATIAALHDLCAARGVRFVLDETYRDFLDPAGGAPHGLYARAGRGGTLVHLYSFSKVFSLAGYRVGAVAAEPGLVAQMVKIMDCIAICAPHIGQKAALFGLSHLDGWVTERRAEMAGRVAAFRAVMGQGVAGFRIAGLGAYFAYLRHPFAGTPARDVARRLAQDHGLLCLPGSMFGPGQEDYLRFAFANVDAGVMPAIAERLEEGAERLEGMVSGSGR